jgi:hypothetical protein
MTHDRRGKSAADPAASRPGDLADLPGNLLAQFVDHVGTAAVGVGGENDERADALASGLVTGAHAGGRCAGVGGPPLPVLGHRGARC